MTFHKTFPHELYCDHRNINCEVHDIVISQAWIFVNCRLANGLGTVIETLVTIWTNLLRVYTLQQQCSLVTQPYHGFYLTVNLVCYSLVNVFIQHNLTDIFHLWHCNSALATVDSSRFFSIQTVQALIRCHILWRLIWDCTFCILLEYSWLELVYESRFWRVLSPVTSRII